MLDHHDGGVGHVDADLDDGGGDQDARLAVLEGAHRLVLLGTFHATVDKAELVAENGLERGEALFRRHQLHLLGFLDQRTDPVDLLAFGHRVANAADEFGKPLHRQRDGADRLPARGLFGELGGVHVAEGGQHQRARDGGGRHHQHVGRIALSGDGEPLVDAEAVLLVHHGEDKVPERHRLLEQRVGADDDVYRAIRQPGQRLGPLAALFPAGEDGGAQTGLRRQRRDGGEMLAGEDFRRRHQGRLAAGLNRARHGKQRHHRLARADVALQQPQHALRLGEVGEDFGKRHLLRAGQRIGERRAQLFDDGAAAGQWAARQSPHPRPDQRQRDLPGQKFIVGEPAPGRIFRRRVERVFRIVQAGERGIEGRKTVLAHESGVEPFRQDRHALDRLADGAAQHLGRKPRRQRIDRLDQRQVFRFAGQRDMVGMHHGRPPVEPLHAARDDDLLAFRQLLFQIGGMGMEEGQGDIVGVVMGVDAVGDRAVAARRRLMAVDGEVERNDLAVDGVGDAGTAAAVDDRIRQHEQQVRCPRSAAAQVQRQHPFDQGGHLRADAGERGDGRKQRVEQGRAHG